MGGRAGSRSVRVRFGAMGAAAVAVVLLAGCGTLGFIKRRLPPPSSTALGTTFRFESRSAKIVQLAGSWPENNWLAGQAQTQGFLLGQMEDPDGDGIWERVERLPAGRWEYKFVVDRVTWKDDPNNPQRKDDGFGGFNSIIEVR
jgi:hypothetical protein